MNRSIRRFNYFVAGIALAAASNMAHAVNVSTDGSGEALIYPYYTTRGGHSTLISVSNNDTRSKAVKVAFREGRNGALVLTFNLFLAPRDVWTAAVVNGTEGGTLLTRDRSCTNPKIPVEGVAFRNFAYQTDAPALRTLDRTREGYFEIVEMASIVADSVTDRDVRPALDGTRACAQVVDAIATTRTGDYAAPTGKLSGAGTLIANSMSTGYNALALQGLDLPTTITTASTELPAGLTSARSKTAFITDASSNRTYTIFAEFDRSIDAVSAVLINNALRGEYSTEPNLATDWVIAMPTKHFYANLPGSGAINPFNARWNGVSGGGGAGDPLGSACESTSASLRNREGVGVSSPVVYTDALCFATSIVSFVRNGESVLSSIGSALGETIVLPNTAADVVGNAQVALTALGNVTPTLLSKTTSRIIVNEPGVATREIVGAVRFFGLPAVGFSVSNARFANSTSNFNSSNALTGSRTLPE
jgi:hypothetical protein